MSRSFGSSAPGVGKGALLIAGWVVALAIIAGLGSATLPAYSQALEPVQHVILTINKSVTLPVSRPFSSATVGSPDIVDALPMTDRALYIQAKKFGTTNVSIFDENMRLIKVVDVEVAFDTRNLQAKIRASTGTPGINVSNDNGQVVLTGTASDAVSAERAVSLAKAWAPNGAVINAMTIASPQQVMLKVRFLEVNRDAGRQLGINWTAINGSGTRGVTTGQGGLISSPPQIGGTQNGNVTCVGGICPPFGSGIFETVGTLVGANVGAPFGVILAEIVNKGIKIDILITALETKGLLQRLAEPNLVALSGDTASFQAGGQFPVPIAVTSGIGIATPTIEFKDFGVLLRFRPTVLNNGIINLSINPEVSELDFTNAVSISGTIIPSVVVRRATTTVELRDGQSFAIAGLLQADNARNISQLPWVGSVPVLGALFRSASYQKRETDLVIIVTPVLVQPAAPGARLATPLDDSVPSNDIDFFLFGQTEQRKRYTDYVASGGNIQGPYGYMLGVFQGPGANDLRK
ncbi:MAG TPA: type II and III secretion system protein family protein [Xanthobacteraceae bacterium]|nr:type II and III secretion system protein family protein [Xanthobacteraceae bacterium]